MAIAIRVADELNDPSLVREPIKKGCGHAIIGKDGIPIAKSQIGSHDDGNLFIEIADQLKEQLRGCLVYRQETKFIDHQKIELRKTSEEARKHEFLLSHLQVIHEGSSLVEADVFALPASGER